MDRTAFMNRPIRSRRTNMEIKNREMSLEDLRKQIDRTDQMLLTSFVTRMRISADIADYKKRNGIAVMDAAREQEKLDEIRKLAPSDMEDYCVMLYNKIMELSKDFQQQIIDKE